MTDHVTTADIADLMRRLRYLHEQRPAHPREQAAVLARKAELLARIADQYAEEAGPCHRAIEAREIANEALAIAENARRLARTGGAKSEENPPPYQPTRWGQISGELRGHF
jgi:predicted transcriptional regulator